MLMTAASFTMSLDAVGDSRVGLAQLASDPLRGEFLRMQDADRST
jgi:hypothetical protein